MVFSKGMRYRAILVWLFALASLGGVIFYLETTVPKLPTKIATHFNMAGVADGWMNREQYLKVSVKDLLTIILIPQSIVLFLQILANRNQKESKAQYCRLRFIELGGLFVVIQSLFFASIHYMTMMANRSVPPQIPATQNTIVMIGFGVAMIAWTVLLIFRLSSELGATSKR